MPLPIFLAVGVAAFAGLITTACSRDEKESPVNPATLPQDPSKFSISAEPLPKLQPKLVPSALASSAPVVRASTPEEKLAQLARLYNFQAAEPSEESLAVLRRSAADPRAFLGSAEYSAFLTRTFVGTENFLKALVLQTAQILKESPSTRFVIEAHTSSIGAADANLELTQRWAETVRLLLEMQGVPPQALRSLGYGEERSKVPEIGSVERIEIAAAQNRRIEIKADSAAE